MGLDTVELVMEVEESFAISIPDDRACEMQTVGDLYSFVLKQTCDQTRATTTCLTAATFYELRRQLAPHVDDIRSCRPRSDVDSTLPRRNRPRLWSCLAHQMDLRFPRLRRPPWVAPLCIIASVLAAIVVYTSFVPTTGRSSAELLALLVALLTTGIIALLTVPLAQLPRASFGTYRGLVTQLVALNHAKLSGRYQTWSPADVWNALQSIIVVQLGVKKEDVTPEANFVNDLGCD